MKKITISTLVALGLAFSSGCFQSKDIKQEAISLQVQVEAYKTEKQQQVDTLNKTFQDTSNQLLDQLTTLLDAQLDLERDLNSQDLADQATLDPNKILMPKTMHDQSVLFIGNQFTEIQKVDVQLTETRKTYADSSKSLQVDLSQLDKCDTALKQLIAASNDISAPDVLQYIEGAFNGVKTGVADAKNNSASAAKAPKAQGL